MDVRLDYCTMNFPAGSASPSSVGDILLGDSSLMYWTSKGLSSSFVVSPHGCSWLQDSGYAPRPHRLQFSGLGCDKFFYKLPSLVDSISTSGDSVSFSRLDFAFDVILSRSDWVDFISNAFRSSLLSDRKSKCYTLAGSGEAMTVYIGKRSSPRFFRIYNKSLEDLNYCYTENGVAVDVPDDSYVIRYEVELKRKLWNRNGERVVVDPSPYFFQYYNQDPELLQMIKTLWLSFGDDVLLPPDFADSELSYLNKNKNFVSLPDFTLSDLTSERVFSEPYSFDRTINYLLDRFGKYIPFLLTDKFKISWFESACKSQIGFLPEYDIDSLIHTDLYCLDSDSENPWSVDLDDPPDQLDFYTDWKEVNAVDS